jgi:uncharacterized membrane protein
LPTALSELPVQDGFRLRGESISRLETFVDAAFAFAVTMMVISIGSVPQSTPELLAALHKAPTMAVCFLVMMIFWSGHNRWSRRYGLDTARTTWLSMLLVLGVLVWVYPQRIVMSSALSFVTGGWVPSEVQLASVDELQNLFLVYSLGFLFLSAILLQLNREGLAQADELSLDSLERLQTRRDIGSYVILVAVALLAIVLTVAVRGMNSIWASSPGFAYMLIGPAMHFHHARFHKQRKALPPRLF